MSTIDGSFAQSARIVWDFHGKFDNDCLGADDQLVQHNACSEVGRRGLDGHVRNVLHGGIEEC